MGTNLEEMVKQFVNDNHISCPETIYQSDWVIENAYEFIHNLVKEVGYWHEWNEEDE